MNNDESKKIVEKDIDKIIKKYIDLDTGFLDLFIRKIGITSVQLKSCTLSERINQLGETDILITVCDNTYNYGILIEDKITASAMKMQYERYKMRGEQYVQEGKYKKYFIFMIAPQNYLDIDEMAIKYDNHISYEIIISYLKSLNNPECRNDIDMLSKAIYKCETTRLKRVYDDSYNRFGCQYKYFWVSNDTWKTILANRSHPYLFSDYITTQKNKFGSLDKFKTNSKVKAISYTNKLRRCTEQIQCTLSVDCATLKFNYFKPQGSFKGIEDEKVLENIRNAMQNIVEEGKMDGFSIIIPENNEKNKKGRQFLFELRKIDNVSLQLFTDDDPRWNKVAYFFGKYSSLLHDNIYIPYLK